MNADPKLAALLAPLTAPDDEKALRRLKVDRDRIISRMVEAALLPEPRRLGSRARVAAALALAAGVTLAGLGGVAWWQQRASAPAASVEVVALRGSVTSVQGGKRSSLSAGARAALDPEGTLETPRGGEARIMSAGIGIVLRENTKVSLDESGAFGVASTLRLHHGRVLCVVPHQPGRTFSVVTAAARVVDIGTTFSVSVEPTAAGPRTVVEVEEGEVRVEFSSGQVRLTAAQSWVSTPEVSKPSREAASPPPPPAAVEPDAAAQGSTTVPSPRQDPVKRPETLAAEAQLLRSGLANERKGELHAAATAFETLVARYPASQLAPDAKAALARVKARLESPP